jgi:rubrerythrin/very-short-patch-repair endonuclease
MTKDGLYTYISGNMFNKNKQWKSTAYFKHIEEDLNTYQAEGSTFNEKLYLFYYNQKIPKCKHCGEKTKFIKLSQGFRDYCSTKCSSNSIEKQEKIKLTTKEKYGVEYITQTKQHIENLRLKYFNKLKNNEYNNTVIEKRRKTVQEKYGVDNVSQYEIFIDEKIKNSRLKFGKNNYNNRFKANNTRFNNFYNNLHIRNNGLVTPLFDINNFHGVSTKYNWKCNLCSYIFEDHLNDGKIPRCKRCFPNKQGQQTSSHEQYLVDYLLSLDIKNIKTNRRDIISPQELDIYLPDNKTAFEINGLYWHSESQGKDKYYHLNKTLKCEEQGIKLIHIFEDELYSDDIKDIILHVLGIKKINIDKFINNNMIYDDRRFNLFPGYKLINEFEPQCWYTEHHYRTKEYGENMDKIWDCGYKIYKN